MKTLSDIQNVTGLPTNPQKELVFIKQANIIMFSTKLDVSNIYSKQQSTCKTSLFFVIFSPDCMFTNLNPLSVQLIKINYFVIDRTFKVLHYLLYYNFMQLCKTSVLGTQHKLLCISHVLTLYLIFICTKCLIQYIFLYLIIVKYIVHKEIM